MQLEISVDLPSQRATRPFLRWAGGKTWLIKHLTGLKKLEYRNYHEPFLGGGAIHFFLNSERQSYLSDLNGGLIETYQSVKENCSDVVSCLKEFRNDPDYYYRVRETVYTDPISKAAQFIYLNQTSYNGIHRVNLSGKYNVPYGFRKKNFIDELTLYKAQASLKNATLFSGDFYQILENVQRHDLVFLDPPYTVSHNDNGFVKYNEKIFSLNDQYRLSQLIDEIKNIGAYYILTNAAHDKVKEIFSKGDQVIEFSRGNVIGGLKAKRGQTNELIFSNFKL